MKGGTPPTLRKERTGLFTPPGISSQALANKSSDLEDMTTSGQVAYQYWKKGTENLLVGTEYIKIEDLLGAADVELGKCDSITAADPTGFASELSKKDMDAKTYYITNDESKVVPAALLISWDSGAKTLDELAKSAYNSGSIRFAYGIGKDEVGSAAGKRLVSGVTTLTVNVNAHVWDNGVVTLLPTLTTEGIKTYTCTECGTTRTEAIAKLTADEEGSDTNKNQSAANETINLINAIGTVTKGSSSSIKAAREAYNKLTDAQKELVSPDVVKILTDAETAYANLPKSSGSSGSSGSSLYPVQNGSNASSGTDFSGGKYGLIFRVSVSAITGVQVDGRTIGKANYTTEGSYPVEVYLKAAYLSKLANGKHTLTILYNGGSLTTEFTIGGVDTSPRTGDAGMAIYVAMSLLSVTGGALTVSRKRREH